MDNQVGSGDRARDGRLCGSCQELDRTGVYVGERSAEWRALGVCPGLRWWPAQMEGGSEKKEDSSSVMSERRKWTGTVEVSVALVWLRSRRKARKFGVWGGRERRRGGRERGRGKGHSRARCLWGAEKKKKEPAPGIDQKVRVR